MNYSKINASILFAIIIGCAIIVFPSCKSKKNAVSNAEQTMTKTEISEKITNGNYHLVLSFYSIGSGADWSIIAEFDRFIERDTSISARKAKVERVTWGREGEVDFCIDLTDLTDAEKKTFIEQSKEIANKAKYVHITENAPCRNKR